MNKHVETQGFDLTPALSAWVGNEIDVTLGRFDRDIRRIDVHLSPANGPDGGKGMSAGVTVLLKHRSPVRITTVNTDMYAAIAISTMRAEQAVDRSLSKRRRWQRALVRQMRFSSAVGAPI